MGIRTDLALEQIEQNSDINGVRKNTYLLNNIEIVSYEILTKEAQQLLNKPVGKYISLHMNDMKNLCLNIHQQIEIVAHEIKSLLPKNIKSALIVGLGNENITPDALGTKVISYIFATRHINENLQKQIGLLGIFPICAIAPGVLGQTGIESAEVVASLTKTCSPDVVIIIDALAAKSINRLGNTIQLSNTGISPGSGVQNSRAILDEETLGVPVISIGVPTVVDMSTIAQDIFNVSEQNTDEYKTMMVTPREIDTLIENSAKLIGYAINKALQNNLSIEEIIELVG